MLKSTCGSVGRVSLQMAGHAGSMALLCGRTCAHMLLGRVRLRHTTEQFVRTGADSVPIVAVMCFLVGLILAMQAAYQLEPFGATIYVADLLAVSMTREMGPMLTAIIVTGRSGSAIAAELGTMKVSEEIDALRTMGIDPIQLLVVPRTLALMVALPCLTLIADAVGIAGGLGIAVAALKLSAVQYLKETADALVMKDLLTGLGKSFFFGLIIAQVGSYQGLRVSGGAEGVGRATTTSVVSSIFLIILADLAFTALFYSTL
ncbi:MAG: ABC transporter permease [Calditrichaeota bacterium]|nr:ABC transporter permease [Calditrichota bacterium]